MEAKTINKYRNKSYSQLHKTAKTWFNKFIRLRDTNDAGYGHCISSGQVLRYGTPDCQAGHFIASPCRALEFDEYNVNLQGKSDNYFKSGNQVDYRINLIEKIGLEQVEQLENIYLQSKRNIHKQNRFEMIEVIEAYKIKVKEISKSKLFQI